MATPYTSGTTLVSLKDPEDTAQVNKALADMLSMINSSFATSTTLSTEYASNSNPGIAAAGYYATGMINDPKGSPINAINSTTASGTSLTVFVVTWVNAVLPTDMFFLEASDPTRTFWRFPLDTAAPFLILNAAVYGMRYFTHGPTMGYVNFGNGGAYPSAGGGSNGQPWGTAFAGCNWRVRKVSHIS